MDRLKVLVADDSVIYRKLVEQTLSQEACSVVFARTGREAISFFEQEHPSLVITDWEMPDLTGVELCQQIRASSTASYTYIMILTSNAEKANVVKGLSAGADDYLTKPFDQGELLARIRVGRRLIELQREIESKNLLLEELALTDALTGLPNRRAIDGWAARQLSGAARHGFSLWVILADLDHFKSINDTYGHDAGDLVLKGFAEILKSHTRHSDISGRIGGEEFLHVLTHADEASAQLVAGRLRKQLEAEEFHVGGRRVKVTASFGLAGFSGKSAPTFAALVKKADTALYRAKKDGRNRVEIESLVPA